MLRYAADGLGQDLGLMAHRDVPNADTPVIGRAMSAASAVLSARHHSAERLAGDFHAQ
jgi:hypothetical protein